MFYNFRDSAEFLFNVLRDPSLNSSATPVLVICNKQDMGIQAKGAGVIERELAKEIGLLRVTKSRLLEVSYWQYINRWGGGVKN